MMSIKIAQKDLGATILVIAPLPVWERKMGRTLLPFSHVLESEREKWKPFRKGLSKEDQQVFDRLFDRAKFHTHAGGYVAHSWPMETILLSICLEHRKRIEEILRKHKKKRSED
jgi:hypothetical protein